MIEPTPLEELDDITNEDILFTLVDLLHKHFPARKYKTKDTKKRA